MRVTRLSLAKASSVLRFQRSEFFSQANRMLRGTTLGTKTHSVIVIDIDRFRLLNQSFGEDDGNQCLAHVSSVLEGQLLEGDALFYIGEDAFAVLCPYRSVKDVAELGNVLVSAVEASPWRHNEEDVALRVSAGIAQSEDTDVDSNAVFSRAEFALYLAKISGGNTVRAQLSATDEANTEPVTSWPAHFRHAFLHDGFKVELKAIDEGNEPAHFVVSTYVQAGAELVALSAIREQIRALDLLLSVDRWVLYKIFEIIDCVNLPPDAQVIFPVSASSVRAQQFLTNLERQLASAGIRPAQLVLAVSATDFPLPTAQLERFLERLGELGCLTMLTDFGCGAGSLVSIFDYPVRLVTPYPALAERPVEQAQLVLSALAPLCDASGKVLVAAPL